MMSCLESIATEFVSELSMRLKQGDGEVLALHEPVIGDLEKRSVAECLDSTFVSTVGQHVPRFEAALAEICRVEQVVATVNGTSALQLALKAVGVEKGDEVLMPALSFVATANAASYLGAIPHFVESESEQLGVCPRALENYLKEKMQVSDGVCRNLGSKRRVKALVVMHTFGHIGKMKALREICDGFGLALVEDAAEAVGSECDGHHAGHWGDVTALSFNGNKIITTGGGGAVLCHDESMAARVRHWSTTAKVNHSWEYDHDELGYNYRMPNLNAALGVAQCLRVPELLAQKELLAKAYSKWFKDWKAKWGLEFYEAPAMLKSNHWLNAMLLPESLLGIHNEILEEANHRKIFMRPVWKLLNRLVIHKDCPSMETPVAEGLASRMINLPSSAFLGERLG